MCKKVIVDYCWLRRWVSIVFLWGVYIVICNVIFCLVCLKWIRGKIVCLWNRLGNGEWNVCFRYWFKFCFSVGFRILKLGNWWLCFFVIFLWIIIVCWMFYWWNESCWNGNDR